MGNTNTIFNNCKICGKKRNKGFYDKSAYRPLCSRECRDKYYDSLPKRYEKKLHLNHYKEIKEPEYEYPVRGKLTLSNYNLNINW